MSMLFAVVTPILFFMALWGIAATWYVVRANIRISQLEKSDKLREVTERALFKRVHELYRKNTKLNQDNKKLKKMVASFTNRNVSQVEINQLDKVLKLMDDESLETEHIANTDIDLESEADDNAEHMRATLKAKGELEELLTEDEKRAWEHGAMSEAMREKLRGK